MMNDDGLIILDAGPLIHLDQLSCLDLLAVFSRIYTPQIVWDETIRHRPLLQISDIPNLSIEPNPATSSSRLTALITLHDLDEGEAAALALLEQMSASIFLTDDAAARAAGDALGCSVHGTLGVLVRGFTLGLRSLEEIHRLLAELPSRSTLYIQKSLLAKVIAQLPAL
jgi:predicted nucleic acid-binding protein